MILVTGGDGQLGLCLADQLKQEAKFLSVDECDITKKENIENVIKRHTPKVLINCAAFTAVDLCESKKEIAAEVNATGAKYLSEICNQFNIPLIHISTDYVFNGEKNTPYTENDPTNPSSVYGETKLAGEEAIKKVCKRFIIIRTSWLYSEHGENFVKKMKSLLSSRETINVVYDQVGSPTYAQDLAFAINQIIQLPNWDKNEIYHFANQGVASWYDLTQTIKSECEIQCNVGPILSEEFPTPAKRPNYSVFNTSKIRNNFKIEIPYWKESLKRCLKKL